MKSLIVLLSLVFTSLSVLAQGYNDEIGFKFISKHTYSSNESCRFNQDVIVTFKEDVENTGTDLIQRVLAYKEKEYRAKGLYKFHQTTITKVMGVELSQTSTYVSVMIEGEEEGETFMSTYNLTMPSFLKIKWAICYKH